MGGATRPRFFARSQRGVVGKKGVTGCRSGVRLVGVNAMNVAIESKREELARVCAKHRVKRLELFGSAAKGGFDASASDLDFLVTFESLRPSEHAESFFGLQEELEALFGRAVELVEASAVRNPYFLKAMERGRMVVYAA